MNMVRRILFADFIYTVRKKEEINNSDIIF